MIRSYRPPSAYEVTRRDGLLKSVAVRQFFDSKHDAIAFAEEQVKLLPAEGKGGNVSVYEGLRCVWHHHAPVVDWRAAMDEAWRLDPIGLDTCPDTRYDEANPTGGV